VEGARAERGLPFERRFPPPVEEAARATLRLFFGLTLHASQNHTPSGATSSPIHPKWNYRQGVSITILTTPACRPEPERERLTHSRSHSVSSHATMSP